jgi:uncharacterized protein (TIGR04255 family)
VGNEPYPHFPALGVRFREEWEAFLLFAEEEKLGSITPNRCELTYINHLDKGAGWITFADLPNAFSVLRAPEGTGIPPPELFSFETRYKLSEIRGRLAVQVQPVFRSRDMKLVLAFNLTAGGSPAGHSTDKIQAWFEAAHEVVVRAFDGLTTTAMHSLWEKQP